MKKISFLVLIFALFLTLLVIINFSKSNDKEEDNSLTLLTILDEINLASNNSFVQTTINELEIYFPIEFNNDENILIAVNNDNVDDYFLIGKNLEINERARIEELYSNSKEKFLFYSDDKYIYLIKDQEYASMIEGIMKSFISNN